MYQLYLQPKVFIPGMTGTNGVGESSTQGYSSCTAARWRTSERWRFIRRKFAGWWTRPTNIRPMVFTPGIHAGSIQPRRPGGAILQLGLLP